MFTNCNKILSIGKVSSFVIIAFASAACEPKPKKIQNLDRTFLRQIVIVGGHDEGLSNKYHPETIASYFMYGTLKVNEHIVPDCVFLNDDMFFAPPKTVKSVAEIDRSVTFFEVSNLKNSDFRLPEEIVGIPYQEIDLVGQSCVIVPSQRNHELVVSVYKASDLSFASIRQCTINSFLYFFGISDFSNFEDYVLQKEFEIEPKWTAKLQFDFNKIRKQAAIEGICDP